jgi:hypothetical protein
VLTAGVKEGQLDALEESVFTADCVSTQLALAATLALRASEALPPLVVESRAERDCVCTRESRAVVEAEKAVVTLGAPDLLPTPFLVKVLCPEADRSEDALVEGCKERDTLAEVDNSGDLLLLLVMEEDGVALRDWREEAEPASLQETLFDTEANGEALSWVVALRAVEMEATMVADAPKDVVSQALFVNRAPVSDGDDEAVPSGVLLADTLKLFEKKAVPVFAELSLPDMDAEVQALVDAGAVRLVGTLGEAIPVRKPENERTGEALSLLTALAVEKLDATALPLLTILTVEVPDAPNEGLVEGLSQPDTIVEGDGAAELDMVAATEEDTVSVTVTV